MDKYILFTPFSFIFYDVNYYILYNSIEERQYIFPNDGKLGRLIQNLDQEENLYSVIINKNEETHPLIQKAISIKLAKIINCSDRDSRPITIPPHCHFINSIRKISDLTGVMDYSVLNNIKHLVIRQPGHCQKHCKNCDSLYKQHIYCNKSNGLVSAQEILHCCGNIIPSQITIIANTSPDISFLTGICQYIFANQCLIEYAVSIYNIVPNDITEINSLNNSILINILVDVSLFSKVEILAKEIRKYVPLVKNNLFFTFFVANESDLLIVEEINQIIPQSNFIVRPYNNGDNLDFLKKYYLLDFSDLISLKGGLNSLFINQEFNLQLFGTIYFEQDGTIKLNENVGAIGSTSDSLFSVFHNAFYNRNNVWLLTREQGRCAKCAFKQLCPPVSNLELQMNNYYACVDYWESLCDDDNGLVKDTTRFK